MGTPSKGRRWVKAARYAAYCVAGLAVVSVAAALFLHEFLDTPAVRAKIQRQLSMAVHGEIAWEKLSVRILPSPHGKLRKVRVEISEVASVTADEVDAHIRLWPLFRGRAEIASVSVVRPVIRIGIAPVAAVEGSAQEMEPAPDVVGLYRSAMGPIVEAIRKFALDSVLAIENAEVHLRAPGVPPIQLSKLSLRARADAKGMELNATAVSPYWSRLDLAARVEFEDLSASARLDAADVKAQVWLDRFLAESPIGVAVPLARVTARIRTDAKTSFDCELDATAGLVEILRGWERVQVPKVAVKGKVEVGADETVVHVSDFRLGTSKLADGMLRYSLKDRSLSVEAGYDIDFAQGMDYTRRLVPADAGAVLAWFRSVTGRARGRVKLAFGRGDWSMGVDMARTDVSVQMLDLPGPLRLAGGAVEVDRHAVKVNRLAISMPAGRALLSTLRYSFKDGAVAAHTEFDFDLGRWLGHARRALRAADRDPLAVIESISGRARGTAKLAVAHEDWSVGVEIVNSDAQVQVRGLPRPAGIAGGSVHLTSAAVRVDRAALSLLDATATASVTISDFRDGPRVRGAVAGAVVGERFLDWVWQAAQAPSRLALKAPIRIAVPSFAWAPKQALDVQATARFDAGPSVAVELGWAAGALDIRRAAIKDERSNATITLRTEARLLEGKFSGSLYSSSIAAMLKSAVVPSGGAAGDLLFTVDRENPRRTTAEGTLKGEALDLAWLTGRPVKIDRIDLAADSAGLRISEATVDWAGQRATLRGEVKRSTSGPVIDAQLDSPGLVVEALRGPKAAATGVKPAVEATHSKPLPAATGKRSRIWPLPVTGRIEFRSDFVQSGRHKVAPVAATIELEEQRVRMDLKQAQLCGISLPSTLEATPQGYAVSAQIAAKQQQLEQIARCLSEGRVLITGAFDLKADITTQGAPAELARNLKGTVRADLRDGRVMKFAVLGNILSTTNVASLMKEGGPQLDEKGFPYRVLIVAGSLEDGRFNLAEGAFRSDALGLAAHGWISLHDPQSRLTVLVAPFSRVDELVRKVPLVGYIVGGTFTSVPVGVSGDIRDPLVVPLGPGAVTSQVLGIFERTLKLPAKLITPLEAK